MCCCDIVLYDCCLLLLDCVCLFELFYLMSDIVLLFCLFVYVIVGLCVVLFDVCVCVVD